MKWTITVSLNEFGQGYDYTASYVGILWAKGWVRASSEDFARETALRIGEAARRAEWPNEMDTGQLTASALRVF
jgi:hypothetical protein